MRRLALAFLVVACIAAACGGADGADGAGDPSGGDTDSVSEADTPPDQLAATGAVIDPATPVRLALDRPGPIDPRRVVLTDQAAVIISDLIYDGLTESVGRAGELRPGLASSWAADEQFTRWVFELDPEAAVSPGDVVAALAPLAEADESSAAAITAGIHSVEAGPGRSVIIELWAPNAGLPWILSGLPYSIPGPKDAPTGDYTITSDDNNGMILHRKPQRAGGPSEVRIDWVDDPVEADRLLTAGLVDGALVEPDARSADGVRRVSTVVTRFYVLNSRSPTLADLDVRLAVLAAVDRRELIESGFEQAVLPVEGLLGRDQAGWTADGGCGPACATDPASATEQADLLGNPTLVVAYSGADQRHLAAAVAGQLVTAGFGVDHTELTPDDLASVIVGGATDLFAFGWIAPATSADAVIPPVLRVDSAANIARIQSAPIADILAVAAVTGDDRARWALLAEAERTALADALILPIATSTSDLALAATAADLVVRADGSLDLDGRG